MYLVNSSIVFNRILGKWPNTYCYTKALAEQVIHECRGDMPVAIFRPSIGEYTLRTLYNS